jgi:hypothetical protein
MDATAEARPRSAAERPNGGPGFESAFHHRGATMTTAMKRFALAAAACALVTAIPSDARAQAVGVRGGVSIDPNQFFFGLHYETVPLVDRVHFRPSLEVGFGDNVTLAALNFEGVYKYPISGTPWRVYAGAGPAINVYRNGGSDARAGFNFLGGVENASGLMLEVKFGVIDSPEFKVAVGYIFKL